MEKLVWIWSGAVSLVAILVWLFFLPFIGWDSDVVFVVLCTGLVLGAAIYGEDPMPRVGIAVIVVAGFVALVLEKFTPFSGTAFFIVVTGVVIGSEYGERALGHSKGVVRGLSSSEMLVSLPAFLAFVCFINFDVGSVPGVFWGPFAAFVMFLFQLVAAYWPRLSKTARA